VSKKETDILLIRKYLNGELDARAMHQLEKRAQSDPFLMDALEGYEHAGREQHDQLTEISGRLQKRINGKERRIIPWRVISIAASILIVVSIGSLLIFKKDPTPKKQIAQVVATPITTKTAKTDTAPAAANKPAAMAKQQPVIAVQPVHIRKSKPRPVASNPVVSENEIASADISKVNKTDKDTSTPLNEVIVMGYTAKQKKAVTGSVATVSSKDLLTSPDSLTNGLQGRVAGVSIANGGYLQKSTRSLPKNRINGRVIAKDDGQPLVGVTVRIKGTNRSSITDLNGKFSISADSGKTDRLVLGYIGYNTAEVTARASDSLKSIALVPVSSSLNEVVVTGYGSRKSSEDGDEPLVVDAHPINGWSSLKKYFDENAVSPDGKKGIVKLSFMVDHSGNITNIKVVKSLSTETDAKAIDLLNNGPGWVGSTSGRTENVTVRVKFTK